MDNDKIICNKNIKNTNFKLNEDTQYTLESGIKYMVDYWCKQISKFELTGTDGLVYKPCTNYKLVKISIGDVKYLNLNKRFPHAVEKKINKLFIGGKKYFFRVSQRSPKDAWAKELKAKKSDTPERKLELELERKSKLYVGNLDQIYPLIFKSKRVQEDFELFTNQSHKENSQIENSQIENSQIQVPYLYLVFQDWRPSNGVEYRLFIRDLKLIGLCLYKPEFYQKNITIPFGSIERFVKSFLSIRFVKKKYSNLILDVYVDKSNGNVYFIEINPYEDYVDPFSFTWDELNKTKDLIIKL
jgi:hypothetical protein